MYSVYTLYIPNATAFGFMIPISFYGMKLVPNVLGPYNSIIR